MSTTGLGSMAGELRRARERERGAAAVEFALVVPLLLVLVFGIISYGYMLSFRQSISQAAAEGARACGRRPVDHHDRTSQRGPTRRPASGRPVQSSGVPAPARPSCAITVCPAIDVTVSWDYAADPSKPKLVYDFALPDALSFTATATVGHDASEMAGVATAIVARTRRGGGVPRRHVSLLVIVGAFAVDLGMQRVVRSDMQALADVVALDLARQLDGRTPGQLAAGDLTRLPGRGRGREPGAATAARLGDDQQARRDARHPALDSRGVLVPVRDASGSAGAGADRQVPDAVLVSATGSVGFTFAGGRGAATRTALAEASTTACHRLGSFAAALGSGDSAPVAAQRTARSEPVCAAPTATSPPSMSTLARLATSHAAGAPERPSS